MPDKETIEFEQQLRERLRGTETELDTRTRARIAAARREAVEQEDGGWSLSIGRPAWGTVAVVLIVAALINLPWNTQQPAPQTRVIPEPLAAGNGTDTTPKEDDQLELYENLELLEFYEDMEFYEWLADTGLEEMPS